MIITLAKITAGIIAGGLVVVFFMAFIDYWYNRKC